MDGNLGLLGPIQCSPIDCRDFAHVLKLVYGRGIRETLPTIAALCQIYSVDWKATYIPLPYWEAEKKYPLPS